MAFLTRRPGGRIEIRETVRTPRGPRPRTLASFRGALSATVLASAEACAEQPFDRDRLVARARELGIPVLEWPASPAARELLGALRRGEGLDPLLVGPLREELARAPARVAPSELAEVLEWVGASDAERGLALRGLLRVSDRIAASRSLARPQWRRRYPRIDSGGQQAA